MNLNAEGRVRRARLRVKDVVLTFIGRSLGWFHVPAMLKPFEYVDPESDETIYLYTDKRLSVLCVGDRRYYFDRITGGFDGTSSSPDRVSGRVELVD